MKVQINCFIQYNKECKNLQERKSEKKQKKIKITL